QEAKELRESEARARIQKIIIDDDDDDTDDDSIPLGDIIARPKAITPDLPIEEPDNFLSMGDEHLDTTPSVENLVPIPRESEGLSDNERECDMPVCDESSLIFMVFSYSLFPVEDNFSRMEEIDLFLTSDDSMPPGIESDDYDSEGDFHFLKELLINDSSPLPVDGFDNPESPVVKSCFDFEPVAAVTNDFDVLNNDESFDSGEGENVDSLNVEEEDSFTFTIRSFLPFVTYPEVLPASYSTGSEDKIFKPGICDNVLTRKSSLTLDVFDPLHPPLMDFHVTKAFSGFTFSLLKLFSKKFFEPGIKNATVYLSSLVWGGKDIKDKKKQKQSKTDKKREKTKSRVKNERQSKPDQPDTARKEVKGQNNKAKD
ncbi:hypothetical protein Tco_1369913, partial [Tanacetum coccineum]